MKVYHGKNNRGGIRDYSRRRYGNPLFRNTGKTRGRKRNLKQIRCWALSLMAIVGLFFGVWYLFWSPAFQITEIRINGAAADTEGIIRASLEKRLDMHRLLIFPQSAVFLYDTSAVEDDIRALFYLDNLDIRKKLPNTVTVTVQERFAVAALLATGEFWALDESGFVIRNLTKRERISMVDLPEGMGAVDVSELGAESVDVAEIEGVSTDEFDSEDARRNSNPMPLLLERENSDGEYAPGDEAVSPEILILSLQTFERLPDIIDSGVRWFALEAAVDTVDVILKEGWHVYLTTIIAFNKQGERLALVMKEKIGERRTELEYVDLRYDERIFFRFREEVGEGS